MIGLLAAYHKSQSQYFSAFNACAGHFLTFCATHMLVMNDLMLFSNMQPKAPDEDALPFKAMNTLAYAAPRARIVPEPEYAHPAWNNVLLAIKKSHLQPIVLVGTLLSHVNHGPYKSGRTLQVKGEVCEAWVRGMSSEQFEALREEIAHDRSCDVDNDLVPDTKEALLNEPTIAARGIFDPWLAV